MAMDGLPRVLILDTDPHTLMTLQHALEQAEIETIITRDEAEACQLLETSRFDLILIGNHPPELDAAAIVDDFRLRGHVPFCLDLAGGRCRKGRQVLSQAWRNWSGAKAGLPRSSRRGHECISAHAI